MSPDHHGVVHSVRIPSHLSRRAGVGQFYLELYRLFHFSFCHRPEKKTRWELIGQRKGKPFCPEQDGNVDHVLVVGRHCSVFQPFYQVGLCLAQAGLKTINRLQNYNGTVWGFKRTCLVDVDNPPAGVLDVSSNGKVDERVRAVTVLAELVSRLDPVELGLRPVVALRSWIMSLANDYKKVKDYWISIMLTIFARNFVVDKNKTFFIVTSRTGQPPIDLSLSLSGWSPICSMRGVFMHAEYTERTWANRLFVRDLICL